MESGSDPTKPGPWRRAAQAARAAWPVVVLVLGAGVLMAGVAVGMMTKPKPDLSVSLDVAERLINDAEFQPALDVLNDEVLPLVGRSWVPSEDRARYHRLVARAVAFGERELGVRDFQNAETIRREFHAAEKAGLELTPEDLVTLCASYLLLGEEERARARVMQLPEDASDARRTILRSLVEHELAKPRPEYDRAIEVLSAITTDADLDPADRAWSLARESEIRLGQGFAAEAVAKLLQGILRLDDAPKGSLAELYVLLGQGHYALGEFASARSRLEYALTMLGTTEPLAARAQVYLAMCDQALGDADSAHARYAAVTEWAKEMDWQLPAMFGLAETEGLAGRVEESVNAYAGLVDAMLQGRRHPLVSPERVAQSLLERARDRIEAEDPRSALRFVLRAEELFGLGDVSAEVLETLGKAHEMLAERMLTEVESSGVDEAARIMALDPTTRATVQRHAIAAGKYYKDYAEKVMLDDNEAYVRSLWASALAFERGGDLKRAIAAYREYIGGVPDDPSVAGREGSQAEARYRVGRSYQALGEYQLAAEMFESLLADGELDSGVGQYAQESSVPLAQVYLADTDETNDEEARKLLEEAVSGSMGDEGSVYFHDALLQLGSLHHRRGEYVRAIERLTEAVERYPDDPQLPVIRFRLADSLRQEAASIEATLARDAMPDARVIELEAAREAHLREALGLFDAVREALEAKSPGQRSESERVALRNSYFFLGDCAFDLGDYDAAVQHYELARERYSQDPASLVAMVQIVNAYIAMGQTDKARAANERAKRFYTKLPEEAWNDPYLPMSRTDWERWLDSTAKLYGFGNQ
ncbi:MAG: tetratricopeptide repeat protein [Planctomycetota bacterium]|nr:tetratricopeptide repeat protein [Planctomycetota bacterium]